MPPRQKGPWSTLATPKRASQIASAVKPTNAATVSTASTAFESGLAVASFLTAAVLINYLGGSTSSLLSRIVGAWAAESLRYLLLTLASFGALFGWHKRNKGGEAAAVWAGAALFSLLLPRLLGFSATILLNKGSEYISTANDIEILTRWTLTALAGCGGAFFLFGWAMGNALYAMPAALYAPGLCSIPIIITAPSLAVIYPYYHQWIGTSIACTISTFMATTYLYTISTTSITTPTALNPSTQTPARVLIPSKASNNVHKWRLQGQLLCFLCVFASFRTISDCLRFTSTNSIHTSSTAIKDTHRTGSLWRCPLKDGGVLSIIENSPRENPELRYRVMKLNHAIMGGQWVLPLRESGRPVYTTFHLQAAARLLLSESATTQEEESTKPRSLHVGLGAGTAVSVLQRKGYITDVVELYTEVIEAAQTYFGVENIRTNLTNLSSESGTAFGGDALKVVPTLEDNLYNLVILDVFSGGFPIITESGKKKGEENSAVDSLSSPAFFKVIKQKMKHSLVSSATDHIENGVLAVNYVGMQDSPELAQLVCTLKRVFITVRCFKDAEEEVDSDHGKDDEAEDKNDHRTRHSRGNNTKKKEHQLGNFVIMATDNIFSSSTTSGSSANEPSGGGSGSGGGDLFSRAQREISELGEGPLDDMEVDVLSRLAKSELSVAWATQEACEDVFKGGDGSGKKVMQGAAQRSHKALAGLHNAAAHWKTMRVQFGDELWTL